MRVINFTNSDYSLRKITICIQKCHILINKNQFVPWLLSILFSEQPLIEFVEKEVPPPIEQQSTSSIGANIFRRAFLEARTNRNNSTKNYRKLGSPEATKIALICSLYQTTLHTLTQMKIEILTGMYNKLVHNRICKIIYTNDTSTNNTYV